MFYSLGLRNFDLFLNLYLLYLLLLGWRCSFSGRFLLDISGGLYLLFLPGTERPLGRFNTFFLSAPKGRLIDSFGLILPNISFKRHAILLDIDLKFQLIILRKIRFEFKPHLILILELTDEIINSHLKFTQTVVLVVLPLDHSKGEVLPTVLGIVGQVEVQSAGVDDHHWTLVDHLEVGFDGDFVLVELLLAYMGGGVPLLTTKR